MGVGTFIELYLTYFAWGFYGVLWDVLLHFGIIFIPFAYILFEAYTDKSESGKGNKIADRTLYEIRTKIILALVVLWIAGLPIMPISYTDLSYTNMVCNGTTRTINQVTGGGSGTGTTYDTSFGTTSGSTFSSVKVPLWWWAVLNISQAISDAVKVKVPCKASLTNIKYNLQANKLTDPNLRQEVADFFNSCYKRASAKFASESPSGYDSATSAGRALIEKNDIGWMGSSFLLNSAGYYKTTAASRGFRSKTEIEGFPYQLSGREKGEHSPGNEPTYGRPYCDEWWNGGSSHPGLKTKLVNSVDPASLLSIQAGIDQLSSLTTMERDEAIIRNLIKASPVNLLPSSIADGSDFHIGGITDGASLNENNAFLDGESLAYLGGVVGKFAFLPSLYLLKEALPIVQAFIMFGIIFLLPLLLVFSNYGVTALLTTTALVVSVKFWPAIWEIGKFFESNLFQAFTSNTSWWEFIDSEGPTSIVLVFVIGAWYIMGPALLTTLMGIAGQRAGSSIQNSIGSGTQKSQSAGEKGASTVGSGAKIVASRK